MAESIIMEPTVLMDWAMPTPRPTASPGTVEPRAERCMGTPKPCSLRLYRAISTRRKYSWLSTPATRNSHGKGSSFHRMEQASTATTPKKELPATRHRAGRRARAGERERETEREREKERERERDRERAGTDPDTLRMTMEG